MGILKGPDSSPTPRTITIEELRLDLQRRMQEGEFEPRFDEPRMPLATTISKPGIVGPQLSGAPSIVKVAQDEYLRRELIARIETFMKLRNDCHRALNAPDPQG